MKEAGMSKKVVSKRTRYSEEFKAEALQLMERVGAKAATEKLGLRDGQLYAWKAA
ncbi:MAG: transposase, partial [Permianibacter sp.]